MTFKLKYTNGLLIPASLIYMIFSGCQPSYSSYPEGNFHIMVISDVHISRDETKDKRLQTLITSINDNRYSDIKALIITGDCVSKMYSEKKNGSHPESSNNLAKLETLLQPLEIPYFLIMGNHDYKIDSDKDSDAPFTIQEIDTMEFLWQKITGFKPYYSVTYNGWKFIMLNSMRGRYLERAFDQAQIEWLAAELSTGQPVLLFFHHPIETDHFHFWGKWGDLITNEKEARFFTICQEYQNKIKGIFVGHGHRWLDDTLYEKIPVYETDSFGESDDLPFYLISIDTVKQIVTVSQSPILNSAKDL